MGLSPRDRWSSQVDEYLDKLGGHGARELILSWLRPLDGSLGPEQVRQLTFLGALLCKANGDGGDGVRDPDDRFQELFVRPIVREYPSDLGKRKAAIALNTLKKRLLERIANGGVAPEPLWLSAIFRTVTTEAGDSNTLETWWPLAVPDWWDALFDDAVEYALAMPTDDELESFIDDEAGTDLDLRFLLRQLQENHRLIHLDVSRKDDERVQPDALTFLYWRYRCPPGESPGKPTPSSAGLADCLNGAQVANLRGDAVQSGHVDQDLNRVRNHVRALITTEQENKTGRYANIDVKHVLPNPKMYRRPGELFTRQKARGME